MTMDQLGVIMMALLPKDGTPRTVQWLADTAYVTREEVNAALKAPSNYRLVQYDLPSDSYVSRREAP